MKVGTASLGGTVLCLVPEASLDYAVDSTIMTWSQVLDQYGALVLPGGSEVELVDVGEFVLYSREASIGEWSAALHSITDAASRAGVDRVVVACGTNAMEVPLEIATRTVRPPTRLVFFGSPVPFSRDPLYSLDQIRAALLVATELPDSAHHVLVADGVIHDAALAWKRSTSAPSFSSAPASELGAVGRSSGGVSVTWSCVPSGPPKSERATTNDAVSEALPGPLVCLLVLPSIPPPTDLGFGAGPADLMLVVGGGGGLSAPWVDAVRAWDRSGWRIAVVGPTPMHPITWNGYEGLPVSVHIGTPYRTAVRLQLPGPGA